MKISVNINPLLGSGMTGIGYYQCELLKALLESDSENSYSFNYFDAKNRGKASIPEWINEKGEKEICKAFPMSAYILMCQLLPVPYSAFFKGGADVSVFFNYFLPPGVKGKSILFVYDMVLRDCPETAERKNKLLLVPNLRRSIRNADVIVTISQFSKRRIIEYYGVSEEKIAVIPCAVNSGRFFPCGRAEIDRTRRKYGIDGEYFLYLGTLEPRKNIPRLIKAYDIAGKRMGKNIPKLVICGGQGWQFNKIFSEAKELSLEKSVVFTGYVDDSDVCPLMSGAKAFCFPSLYEGFGMPPLEAMACGTPVIVSDRAAIPEVVGSCGIKVDPYSTEEISDALIKICDNDFAEQQAVYGIERSKAFSWEKSAEMLLDIIKNIY